MNQCDGCRAGWEVRNGLHYDRHGKVQMTCTATRYPMSWNAIKTLPNGDTEGFSTFTTSMVPEQTEAYAHETDTETLIRTSNLPRPLVLAEALERTMQWPLHGKAADELRRLHQSEREGWRYADELEQQRKNDEALLRQALEKLEKLRVTIDSEWGECRDLDEIDAAGDQWPVVNAIRERLGTKT